MDTNQEQENRKAERRRMIGRALAGAGATAVGYGAGYMVGGSTPLVLSKSPKFARWWTSQSPRTQHKIVNAGRVVGTGVGALASEAARQAIQNHIHRKNESEKVAHVYTVYFLALGG